MQIIEFKPEEEGVYTMTVIGTSNKFVCTGFLLADVEIVATYKLANINRVKLENIIHKFFNSARLDIEIKDRFGKPVRAREWFLVPIFIIDELVEIIKKGELSDYYYDPKAAELKKR